MGLDMYLDKVKRLDKKATLDELGAVNEYFGWKKRPEKYKKCSMKKWCGIDRKDVPDRLIKKYTDEYVHRYSAWDTEKSWGYETIFQNVAYWRKANQIHRWFVENVQNGVDDCGMYEVSKRKLEELLETCEIVLKHHDMAEKLLPSQEGFFFGTYDYDDWYYENVRDTTTALKKVLSETDFDNWIVFYTSSW